MRLELGSRVTCADAPFGQLADVVIDPTSRRVTHLVIEPDRAEWLARLVPIELADVEIRRGSDVESADRHHLGYVDGFLVDRDDYITHLVLERGPLWGRREVTIPIGAVAGVETDSVRLGLTKDQVSSLPELPVRRWQPRAGR
jgi:sporulation protein YlmC with PRC-barrel domain